MNYQTISKIINNGFSSELEVKDFFTEVRLLLERLNPKIHRYGVIKFYADWMLHIKKDNLGVMGIYFTECDTMLNQKKMLPDRHEFNNKIEAFTSFVKLREQLLEFLTKLSIKTDFVEKDSEWTKFSTLLRNLVLRKPILFKNFKSSGTRRKMILFVLDTKAKIMIDIPGAIYWLLYIDTSRIPLSGVVPESIGLKGGDWKSNPK